MYIINNRDQNDDKNQNAKVNDFWNDDKLEELASKVAEQRINSYN